MRSLVLMALVASVSSSGCTISTAKVPSSRSPNSPAVVQIADSGNEQSQSVARGRNGGLPPGIARNLERGKPLPPGIAKQHVPTHILAQLPSLEDGFEYVVVAGKILLIEIATQLIHDVLVDVILE